MASSEVLEDARARGDSNGGEEACEQLADARRRFLLDEVAALWEHRDLRVRQVLLYAIHRVRDIGFLSIVGWTRTWSVRAVPVAYGIDWRQMPPPAGRGWARGDDTTSRRRTLR